MRGAAFALLLAPLALVQETPEALEARARELESRGALDAARDALLALSRQRQPGPARDACVDAARAFDMRLSLRRELVDARALDERVFGELGILGADAEGLRLEGRKLAWNDAPFELLGRAAAAARVSAAARAGLVLERLARGDAREAESALTDLARLVEKQELAAHDASAAVARVRREPLPARGYLFRAGKWIDADALERDLHASGLEGLGRALETPAAADRVARLSALDALGEEGHARADLALATRWQAALAEIAAQPGYDALCALAAEHAELEARRAHALELIFDEKTYFYPYAPPECPPEKAKLYAGVQQEVDKRVAAVRECWKSTRRVRDSERLRALAEDLAWSQSVQAKRKLAFHWPASVPEWVRWLDPRADTLELASFACDAKERARLAQDAEVASWNAAAFAARESDKLAEPNNEERAQLAITNEYRRMLGRAQLAWSRKLQLSAQKHSDYQSKTGDFGHFEQDPARRSPFDRMKLEGYRSGGGENCHMGDSGPEGAHVGWIHSSGHHRQVLSERAHELGVGVSGSYWTQNYGDGMEWRETKLAPAR